MNINLTSKFLTAALALTFMAGSCNLALAQKNVRLWNNKSADLPASILNSSQARTNALISKPGNSQDYVSNGSGGWQLYTNSAYTYDTQGKLTQRIYTD